MRVRIDVMLKDGVLDPQGKAIGHALGSLGFKGVSDVRVGKTIILTVAETDPATAAAAAKEMAEKILANLVIEDFKITIM